MHRLKPCPFCGSDQVRVELSIYGYPFVICLNCRTTSRCADLKGKDGIKEVVKVWNKRVDPKESVAESLPLTPMERDIV